MSSSVVSRSLRGYYTSDKSSYMDFYYLPESSPCRSIIMLADLLGVKLNKKFLSLKNGEHLQPTFLKINPQHTVPTLIDGDFALWESRAILIYLAEKYGKDDALYPKCPKKRAVVNQRLYFDWGLYEALAAYYYPIYRDKKPADSEMFKKLEVQLDFLNTFLEGHKYATGDTLTVADLALLATVSTLDVLDVELKSWANVAKWYECCKKAVPAFTENWEGCLKWKKYWD